jgi:aspartate aminotransferase-like enzyme
MYQPWHQPYWENPRTFACFFSSGDNLLHCNNGTYSELSVEVVEVVEAVVVVPEGDAASVASLLAATAAVAIFACLLALDVEAAAATLLRLALILQATAFIVLNTCVPIIKTSISTTMERGI